MPSPRRLILALKTIRQLGLRQAGWYALYQAGLRSGVWRARTRPGRYTPLEMAVQGPFVLPEKDAFARVFEGNAEDLLTEAGAAAAGVFRAYGGQSVPIALVPPGPLRHWAAAEHSLDKETDVKDLWEPARFGWAFTLGRAYHLTGREAYAAAFWQHLETFLQANPPNMGIHWASGQEVALRLLALLFAAQVFRAAPPSTPGRMALLAGALAAHAARIPPTLSYAQAQHNNHLVSEALGLLLAGCALAGHPQSERWKTLGRRTLDDALLRQIRPDGVYAQHSLNYHRLLLHAALVYFALVQAMHLSPIAPAVQSRLRAATNWLLAQIDPLSGRAPNYGHHDGANILPLAAGDWNDLRPTAQAAARAFLGQPAFPPGPWDELSLWLGLPTDAPQQAPGVRASSPAVYRLDGGDSWAVLRAECYTSRPAHADQLHVDLWWRGEPVTLDPGTFRYNAVPPWQNALAATLVHNTVQVAGRDQMLRAGRFLWLDWAQARLLDSGEDRLAAEHAGYRRLGVLHRRDLIRLGPEQWLVEDTITAAGKAAPPLDLRLHWLLPDAPYTQNGAELRLTLPAGTVTVRLSAASPAGAPFELALVRAGQALVGPAAESPVLGWFSPTYSVKLPALSLALSIQAALPVRLRTEFFLAASEMPGAPDAH